MNRIKKALFKLKIALINLLTSLVTISTLWFYDWFLKQLSIKISFQYMQWLLTTKKKQK